MIKKLNGYEVATIFLAIVSLLIAIKGNKISVKQGQNADQIEELKTIAKELKKSQEITNKQIIQLDSVIKIESNQLDAIVRLVEETNNLVDQGSHQTEILSEQLKKANTERYKKTIPNLSFIIEPHNYKLRIYKCTLTNLGGEVFNLRTEKMEIENNESLTYKHLPVVLSGNIPHLGKKEFSLNHDDMKKGVAYRAMLVFTDVNERKYEQVIQVSRYKGGLAIGKSDMIEIED